MTRLSLFLSVIISMCILWGCSSTTVFQRLDVNSTDCKYQDGYLSFESDTLRVVYLFWAENGIMAVFIHNKTNSPLYVDWKKCSFITGEIKHDYWDESTTISTFSSSTTLAEEKTNAMASAAFWFSHLIQNNLVSSTGSAQASSSSTSNWFQQTFSGSVTHISKSERITFIPPHTTISPLAYRLVPSVTSLGGSKNAKTQDTSLYVLEYQQGKVLRGRQPTQKKEHMLVASYSPQNSPFMFRSFLTYSQDEKFSTEHYLDSHFFVERILELPMEAFDAQAMPPPDDQEPTNMWMSPSSFYALRIARNSTHSDKQ